MKVAVVGATGLVGTKMLQVLAERNFPVTELIPVASEKSIGKDLMLQMLGYTDKYTHEFIFYSFHYVYLFIHLDDIY